MHFRSFSEAICKLELTGASVTSIELFVYKWWITWISVNAWNEIMNWCDFVWEGVPLNWAFVWNPCYRTIAQLLLLWWLRCYPSLATAMVGFLKVLSVLLLHCNVSSYNERFSSFAFVYWIFLLRLSGNDFEDFCLSTVWFSFSILAFDFLCFASVWFSL